MFGVCGLCLYDVYGRSVCLVWSFFVWCLCMCSRSGVCGACYELWRVLCVWFFVLNYVNYCVCVFNVCFLWSG